MRKVTKAAVNAFYQESPANIGNTSISVYTMSEVKETILYLFGNPIARIVTPKDAPKFMQITDAGWQTRTTIDRLNGLGCSVYTRKGQLFLDGKEWSGNWTTVSPNQEFDAGHVTEKLIPQ